LSLPLGSRKRFPDEHHCIVVDLATSFTVEASIDPNISEPLRPYALLYNATAVGWKLGSCSAPRMHPRAMARCVAFICRANAALYSKKLIRDIAIGYCETLVIYRVSHLCRYYIRIPFRISISVVNNTFFPSTC